MLSFLNFKTFVPDGVFPTFQIEFTNQSNNRNITSKLYGNQHKIPRLPQVALQTGYVNDCIKFGQIHL